jgi:hypothetical protein
MVYTRKERSWRKERKRGKWSSSKNVKNIYI